ncbi:MAG: restriction endonuclease [bacterium]|nr:restriction endonuclease [bacterium]
MATKDDLPTSFDLLLPTLQAIERLGGSAQTRQLREAVLETLNPSEEMLALKYPTSGDFILRDRTSWARSDCKTFGTLEQPRRGLYLLTALGREILVLPEDRAVERLRDLQRAAEAAYRRSAASKPQQDDTTEDDDAPLPEEPEEPTEWRDALLDRLHRMSPTAFEHFVLYLLRSFDLELEHTGGSGDEGIDGIGVAPISPVLSAKVAVQVKRYNPASPAGIGRQEVALFQRDAEVTGAERAIMVTLGRYTPAARKASQATTPMVDLIDGEKLCDLVREQEVGIRTVPQVVPEFFDRFESAG